MCRERSLRELNRMRLLALAESQESTADALRKWAASMGEDHGNPPTCSLKPRKQRSNNK
jgi:hypothetical protein